MVDSGSVILGITLILIATPMFNIGIIFQKIGLVKSKEIRFDKGIKGITSAFKEIIRNKYWLIGAVLGTAAWFPYVMSISLVGFMVTEPINSVGIIIVVIAANRILKEKIMWYEFLAILVLIFSPLLIAFSGISKVYVDLYDMVIPLIIFLSIGFSIAIFCFVMSIKKRGTNLEGFYIMLTGAFVLALGGVFTNVFAQAVRQAGIQLTWYTWAEIFFGIFWGDYYHLWIFIGWWGLVFCGASSFAFYQSAFQKSRIAVIFPILDSVALAIPILAGTLVFKQTFNNYFLFFAAIALIFIGTTTLGRFQARFEELEAKRLEEENMNNK